MIRHWNWRRWVGRLIATRGSRRSGWRSSSAQILETRALLAAFGAGNVVVYRVGTGTQDLVNTGNDVFVDEYTPEGTLVQSVAIPKIDPDGAGPQRAFAASGVATSEGGLTRSVNGRYLLVPGYAGTAATSLASTSPATVNRVIARVDAAGMVDTATSFNDGGSNNIRSAASVDGAGLWVGTAGGGVRYLRAGTTGASAAVSSLTNIRVVQISQGQLFASSQSGSSRLGTVGTGVPTTSGQAFTNLPGFPTTTGSSPYGYFLADLSPSITGDDTLYVSDDSGFALRKYSLVNGNWELSGTVGVDADDYRGLTGVVSGTEVTLFATRKGGSGVTGGGELVRLRDGSGYAGPFSGTPTVLATAASRTTFRGVALAPVASNPLPDLTIGLSAPATAATGSPFEYTVTLTNAGTSTASGVVATLSLPPGLAYVESVDAGGFSGSFNSTTRVVSFAGGSLTAGASVTPRVRVSATVAGTYTVAAGEAVIDPDNTVVEGQESNNGLVTAVVVGVSDPSANTPPTLVADTVGTTRFLRVTAAGPTVVGGVMNDPTDPARTLGIVFTVGDAETAAGSLSFTATSSNSSVVPADNLQTSGSGSSRTLKIIPVAVGYSTLTVTVSDGAASAQYTIQYAASAASTTLAATIFPSGSSDASTAIAIDSQHTVVADDEDQVLRLYRRDQSGLPLAEFDFTSSLGLTDLSGGVPREVDLEAATRVGNTIYWLGSHSNSANGNSRPNRSRVFATTLSGTGASTTLTYASRYDHQPKAARRATLVQV
ncbi:MAG: CARDB domain-containing protein [Planctomycetaceae bacterium]